MKIPKCPHCDRMAASGIEVGIRIRPLDEPGLYNSTVRLVVWFCPETSERIDPEWVDMPRSGKFHRYGARGVR